MQNIRAKDIACAGGPARGGGSVQAEPLTRGRGRIEQVGVLIAVTAICVAAAPKSSVQAQAFYDYDFHQPTAELMARGAQALLMCNGLFVSERTLAQIYDLELQQRWTPGSVPLSQTEINYDLKAVAVGSGATANDPFPTMRSVYRDGLGCVVMAPDQSFGDIERLPTRSLGPFGDDGRGLPWPNGEVVEETVLPSYIDEPALAAAAEWVFNPESSEQATLSFLIVHGGNIVMERYAPGITMTTKTRTWSAAKSFASTVIGIAVGQDLLELDAPLPIEWAPDELNEYHARHRSSFPMIHLNPWPPVDYDYAADPRSEITLRHVLDMTSGLYPVDNEYRVTRGSSNAYSAGWNSALHSHDRGLVRRPGSVWDYENFDTLLGVFALRNALPDDATYLEFPSRELFDKIGMRNTTPGVDRFGNFVMSSQIYTNARDMARLGLLYLNDGAWNGEQILPKEWVRYVRTPACATRDFGNFYSGQWWLVQDERTDIPQDAYTMAGARGNYAVVIPSYDLVIVRRGLDRSGMSVWDMVAEVLKAFPENGGGGKPVRSCGSDVLVQ
jgi:CubicO group peptidase (beta-lactamase class C family)